MRIAAAARFRIVIDDNLFLTSAAQPSDPVFHLAARASDLPMMCDALILLLLITIVHRESQQLHRYNDLGIC